MTQPEEEQVQVTSVPLLDLKAQYSTLRDDIEVAIREVCESQYFVLGPQVIELEEKIAKYSNVEFGIGEESNVLYITIDKSLYRIRLKVKGYQAQYTK